MNITADTALNCLVGAAVIGSIVTFLVTRRTRILISRAQRLSAKIHRHVETLALFCDLTDVQMKQIINLQTLTGPPRRLANIDEIFAFYLWAEGNRLDPISGSALAIICEKCLGLTRLDALHAMRKVKRADEYKVLLPSRNRETLKISN
ncbi:MAG: hypothetical protein ABSC72_07325 [Methylovirgula sp.]|jgi:hypothetical protein